MKLNKYIDHTFFKTRRATRTDRKADRRSQGLMVLRVSV